MNQVFVFMDEPTTCFHYLFDYKLIGSYVSSNEVYETYTEIESVPLTV